MGRSTTNETVANVSFTIEGEILESGFVTYDFPMGFNENDLYFDDNQ